MGFREPSLLGEPEISARHKVMQPDTDGQIQQADRYREISLGFCIFILLAFIEMKPNEVFF